ncbi:MAG: hypothetical protein QGD88_07845 [Anaerolineae bacterium]|nr:hypothetical protein [Anaerolineae bacterium]
MITEVVTEKFKSYPSTSGSVTSNLLRVSGFNDLFEFVYTKERDEDEESGKYKLIDNYSELVKSYIDTGVIKSEMSIEVIDDEIRFNSELKDIESQLKEFELDSGESSNDFYNDWILGFSPDTFENNFRAILFESRLKMRNSTRYG